jgi:hypothetical protein
MRVGGIDDLGWGLREWREPMADPNAAAARPDRAAEALAVLRDAVRGTAR